MFLQKEWSWGKCLEEGRRWENYRGDMEKSYKWGFMVGQEVEAHEEGEQWEKNSHSSDGMCSQVVPMVAPCTANTIIQHQQPIEVYSLNTDSITTLCTCSPHWSPNHTVKWTQASQVELGNNVDTILPIPVSHSPPPSNLSALSTGVTQPFGTLQHHVNHSHSYLWQLQRSYHFTQPPSYTRATPIITWGPTITHSHPSGIGLRSLLSPLIPPGIPLESWNSTGLDVEFDIQLDCTQNITGILFVSPYPVPLYSMEFLQNPWNVQWNSMGQVNILGLILMWGHIHMMILMWNYKCDATVTTCDVASFLQTTTTNAHDECQPPSPPRTHLKQGTIRQLSKAFDGFLDKLIIFEAIMW